MVGNQNGESNSLNALKTLSLRITKTSTELEAMGEDASYAYESTADYRREVLAITGAYGKQIDIMDEATGGYKSTYQILKELSEVWDEIDDAGKQSLLYTLGGARQVNVLSAILKNFDDAEAVVKSAADATGSALAENEKYLDSIMGKWSQVQASFQALSETLVDNEAIKMLLDMANALLQVADAGTKVIGGLGGLSVGLASYMLLGEKGPFVYGKGVNRTIRNLFTPFDNPNGDISLKNFTAHLKQGQSGVYMRDFNVLKNAFSQLGFDSKGKAVTNLGGNIDDIITKINVVGEVSDETNKKLRELFETDITNTGSISAKSIDAMATSLGTASKKATQFKNTLAGIGKAVLWAAAITAAVKAVQYIGDAIVTTVEEHQEKIDEYTEKIQSANDELEKLYELQQSGVGVTDEDEKRIAYLQEYIRLLTKANEAEQESLNRKNLLSYRPFEKNDYKEAQKIIGDSSTGESAIHYAKQLYTIRNDKTYSGTALGQWIENNPQINDEYQKAVDDGYRTLTQNYVALMEYAEQLNNALKASKSNVEKEEYRQRIAQTEAKMEVIQRQIDTILSYGVVSGREDYNIPTTETKYSKRDTWNLFDNYDGKDLVTSVGDEVTQTIHVDLNLEDAKDQAENLRLVLKDVQATSFDQLNSEIDNMQSAISTVVKAYTEYSTTGAYTLDTLQSLSQLEGPYIDLLMDEEGQLTLNEQKIRDLTTARVEEMRMKILQTAITDIEALTNEAAATKVVEEAKLDEATAMRESTQAVLENVAAEMMLQGVTGGFSRVQQDAINIIINRANALMKAIDVSDMYTDRTKAAKDATDKMNDALRDQGDLLLKAIDQKKKPIEDEIEDIEDRKDALQDEIDVINDKQEALQKELDKLNEIYEVEDKEFKLQKLKDAYERAKANKTVRLYTHDKGWQWVADPSEVKEAEDAYKEYQRELERDAARKEIEDQIDALEDAKEAIEDHIDALDDEKEALQEQIEKYDELKEKIQEAMENIGLTQEEHLAQTQLLAEIEGLTYDQLAGRVADYANTVINSYNNMAAAAANYNKVVEEAATTAAQVRNVSPEEAYRAIKAAQLEDTNVFTKAPSYKQLKESGYQFKYHTGGFVKGISSTANVSPAFRAYMEKLERDEVPAVLEAGEFVLTKQHQKAILDNNNALTSAVNNNSRNISLEIGDIHINNPVGDVDTLSNAIIKHLPNQIMKDLYR